VISEGLRQDAGANLRVTVVTPGMTRTDFAHDITSPAVRARIATAKADVGIAPDAIARAVAYAIEQPDDVDVGEVIVRPTAQS
jgi:NADP-dependent 3-hydroxy acid dehydrogenase YdfG